MNTANADRTARRATRPTAGQMALVTMAGNLARSAAVLDPSRLAAAAADERILDRDRTLLLATARYCGEVAAVLASPSSGQALGSPGQETGSTPADDQASKLRELTREIAAAEGCP